MDDRIVPITKGAAVTPHDTNLLPQATRALMVGVSGDVKVKTVGGDTITLPAVAAGVMHPIAVSQVFSTGTTATTIVALY